MACSRYPDSVLSTIIRSFDVQIGRQHLRISPQGPRLARTHEWLRSLHTAIPTVKNRPSTTKFILCTENGERKRRSSGWVGEEDLEGKPEESSTSDAGLSEQTGKRIGAIQNEFASPGAHINQSTSFDKEWGQKVFGSKELKRGNIERRRSPTSSWSTFQREPHVKADSRNSYGQRKARELGNGEIGRLNSEASSRSTRPERFLRSREQWQIQKKALAEKFGSTGWQPRKKLSPDALEGIRALHAQNPEKYSTPALADQFEVSPEAIRRILRSKWRPSDDEEEDRKLRWEKRGQKIWSQMSELGVKPPKKWRGVGGDEAGEGLSSIARPRISEPWDRTATTASAKKAEYIPLAERIL